MPHDQLDILVIGDCSIDQYMQIDSPEIYQDPDSHEPKICFYHGSKILIENFETTLAGNACHVAVGAQRLGMKTAIYTELGDDENGQRFIDKFKDEKIDTKYCVQNKNTPTNIHAIISTADDRTIFSYHHKYEYSLPFEELVESNKPKWIYYTSMAQGFKDFQKNLVEYLKKNSDIGVVFSPGTIQMQNAPKDVLDILEVTDILLLNKQEACQITGDAFEKNADVKGLHEKLHKLGPKLTLITHGKHGSSAYDGNELVKQEITRHDGPIVDKTGTGDAYAAAFIAALHNKKTLKEAMVWGSKNAANTVKYVGCLEGLLDRISLK